MGQFLIQENCFGMWGGGVLDLSLLRFPAAQTKPGGWQKLPREEPQHLHVYLLQDRVGEQKPRHEHGDYVRQPETDLLHFINRTTWPAAPAQAHNINPKLNAPFARSGLWDLPKALKMAEIWAASASFPPGSFLEQELVQAWHKINPILTLEGFRKSLHAATSISTFSRWRRWNTLAKSLKWKRNVTGYFKLMDFSLHWSKPCPTITPHLSPLHQTTADINVHIITRAMLMPQNVCFVCAFFHLPREE